jgi:hypothetical protein
MARACRQCEFRHGAFDTPRADSVCVFFDFT